MDTFNNDLQFHKCLVTDTLYGDWYEIMSFQKTGSCVKIRFTPNEDGKSYGLEASAILSIFQMFGIKKPTLRAGNLTVPNPENPAKMDLNFPSTTKDLWIVDTDYKTYLATWNCKENYFGHYQTASIMSRERKMDPKLLKKVRNIFAQYHINTYDFNYIGQKDCPDLQTIRRDGVLFPL
ncbi:Apolipoprotein D [Nymphon striatum]|nr:Apolipoprotein D [Nymphon striatum]